MIEVIMWLSLNDVNIRLKLKLPLWLVVLDFWRKISSSLVADLPKPRQSLMMPARPLKKAKGVFHIFYLIGMSNKCKFACFCIAVCMCLVHAGAWITNKVLTNWKSASWSALSRLLPWLHRNLNGSLRRYLQPSAYACLPSESSHQLVWEYETS